MMATFLKSQILYIYMHLGRRAIQKIPLVPIAFRDELTTGIQGIQKNNAVVETCLNGIGFRV
jgi:hypothetical protein